MSNIYLIRHGFTPANNANYNGQEELYTIAKDKDMPLEIEYGRKQALEMRSFFDTLKGKNLVLVSPYRRAKETMKLALPNKDNYEIVVRDELREINSGVHYATTKKRLWELYPEVKEIDKKFLTDPLNTKYLNGESQNDVKNRVKDIALEIKKISEENTYSNIIIFGHGTANRWLAYWITGKFIEYPPKNGEIIKLTKDDYETVFIPETFVPLGYTVDIDKHKELTDN